MRFCCFYIFWLLLLGYSGPVQAQVQTPPQAAKIDTIVNACIHANSKDKICEALVELKQIGDDAIEIIKNYYDLSPRDYAILTAVNVIIQGRFRIRTKSQLIPKATDIYDIRKDQFLYLIELSF